MLISGDAKFRTAVLGSPISHSLSPRLHNRAYEYLGLNGEYSRFEIQAGGLSGFLAGCESDFLGFSVTMPLKGEAFDLSENPDVAAIATSAVNTLVRTETGWQGFNTDVPGAVAAMYEKSFSGIKRIQVLGAGATARSLIVACAAFKPELIQVHARREAGFMELAEALPEYPLQFIPLAATGKFDLTESDLLINTLPGDLANAYQAVGSGKLFDVTYMPRPTKLISYFPAENVVSGKDLLLHQALVQIELMTGQLVVNNQELLDLLRSELAD